MAARDRTQVVKQMVANDKKMTVLNLSGVFQITEETIRHDLEKLEGEDFSTRTYGGAVLNTVTLMENTHFYKRASSFYEEKQLAACKVLPFTDSKITMTADPSSTVIELLKLLQDRSNLMLLTNPAEAIHALAQSEIKVVPTGGELNRNTLSLQGRITKEVVSRYHVDTMIMSCKGFDINSGVLDSNEAEAETKKTMTRQATEVVLLVDHSRLDRKAFVQLADFSHINYTITDRSSGAEWTVFCEDNNIQLVWQFKHTLSILPVPVP